MTKPPRIALVHATPVAVGPIKLALETGWPGVEAVNILEDSLSTDRAASPELTDALATRILDLAKYAANIGSDAILFTCSAFGSAIETAAAQLPIPVLKPNEAMFESARQAGDKIAMLYTFPPARAGMEQEFRDAAARVGSAAEVSSFHVPEALDAARAGDINTHNRLVSAAAARLQGFDAIMLAHFSTSTALTAVREVTAARVLSSPDAAVARLYSLVLGGNGIGAKISTIPPDGGAH